MRSLLAACLLTAAAIHFGYAPAHLGQDWAHGLFFVLIAWLQAGAAVLVLTRPRRWVSAATLVLNLGIISVWAVSRTAGLPFGPIALRTQDPTAPDVIATVLESMVVLLTLVSLRAPALALRTASRNRFATALTSVAILAAIGAASLSLSPRFADSHSAAAHGSASAHGSTAAPGQTGNSPCEQAGTLTAGASSDVAIDGHNVRGSSPQVAIDQATRALLEQQQALARTVATRYPTVAEAQAAGYAMSTPYVPCIGAHYTNLALVSKFDPANPSELLYDGTAPTAKIVGLSYLVFHPGGPPEGFAGPNDIWHQHNSNGGLCLNGKGVVVGAEATTAEQCSALGGRKVPLPDVWMLHDWIVPGWECSWGVFAGECPELGGRVGGTAWDTPDPSAAAAGLKQGS